MPEEEPPSSLLSQALHSVSDTVHFNRSGVRQDKGTPVETGQFLPTQEFEGTHQPWRYALLQIPVNHSFPRGDGARHSQQWRAGATAVSRHFHTFFVLGALPGVPSLAYGATGPAEYRNVLFHLGLSVNNLTCCLNMFSFYQPCRWWIIEEMKPPFNVILFFAQSYTA